MTPPLTPQGGMFVRDGNVWVPVDEYMARPEVIAEQEARRQRERRISRAFLIAGCVLVAVAVVLFLMGV